MSNYHKARRILIAPALLLALAGTLAACSSSSPSSATSTPTSSATPAASSSSSAVAEITANWDKFFSASTTTSERVALLQNGSVFSSTLTAFDASPFASAVTAKVDSVTLTSSTTANVKYNLSALGTTVASGATGTAVLQDGTWKVGDSVFCGLLTEAKGAGLTIPVPAACSSAS